MWLRAPYRASVVRVERVETDDIGWGQRQVAAAKNLTALFELANGRLLGGSAGVEPAYSKFSAFEGEYLERCLTGALTQVEEGGRPRGAGFADIPHVPAARIRELHDNDLLHMISELRAEGQFMSRSPNMAPVSSFGQGI